MQSLREPDADYFFEVLRVVFGFPQTFDKYAK
jgi:hypothetical protein